MNLVGNIKINNVDYQIQYGLTAIQESDMHVRNTLVNRITTDKRSALISVSNSLSNITITFAKIKNYQRSVMSMSLIRELQAKLLTENILKVQNNGKTYYCIAIASSYNRKLSMFTVELINTSTCAYGPIRYQKMKYAGAREFYIYNDGINEIGIDIKINGDTMATITKKETNKSASFLVMEKCELYGSTNEIIGSDILINDLLKVQQGVSKLIIETESEATVEVEYVCEYVD